MRENFEPTVWGPHAWFFLESVAMAYPAKPNYNEKKAADNFFNSLRYIIPCEKCRKNYNSHLKTNPLNDKVLSSRDNLFMWIVKVHNSVDPSKKRSYDDTFKYYMKQYGLSNESNEVEESMLSMTSKFLILLIFVFIIIYLSYQIYISLQP